MARLSLVRQRRIVASATALGLLAAATVSYTLDAATNPNHSIHVSCVHQVGSTELDVDFSVSGPDSATPGAALVLTLDPHEATFPAQSNGVDVASYQNVRTTVEVTGATVQGAEITQPGSVDASVAANGNSVTVTIPGPIPGGGTITTPQVSITTTVTAAEGESVGVAPGAPFYAVTANTIITANVECVPANAQEAANATLTIPVAAADTAPPSITFIEPNASSVYAFGEEIAAAYTCSDASPPVTCTGTVANGAPIDTSSAGVKEFTVTATDALGNTTTETVEYAVLPEGAPPPDRPAYTPLDPARLLDTRSGDVAATVDGAFVGVGKSAGGHTIALDVAGRATIPDDAIGVVLNVTATENEGPGHVTVFPCGEERPVASNLNYAVADDVRANAVFARIGDDGQVCLYTFGAPTHLVVDVAGYFPAGARYVGFNPGRLLDTRPDKPTVDGVEVDGATAPNGEVALQVGGRHNVPDSALAAVLNVTAIADGGPGYATVYPCGEERPIASNVNYGADEGAVPNLVVAKLGADGTVCLFTGVSGAHLIVDVAGYLPAGADYVPLNPGRLLDTRPGRPTVDGDAAGLGQPAVGTPIELQVGGRHGIDGDAAAAVLNVTATEAGGPGYLKVYPCGAEPNASSVNFAAAGQTRANAVVAKLSDAGTVCLVARPNAAHIVVDVAGFVPAQEPTPTPPPPPPSTTTTTTTTTVPGSTPTTEPGVTTTSTTVPPASCLEQTLYDTTLAIYNLLPNPLLLTVLNQLDPDGNGNACDD